MHHIDEIYTQMPYYGHRRIWKQLLDDGIAVGKHRVAEYMKVPGIKALYPSKKCHMFLNLCTLLRTSGQMGYNETFCYIAF